MLAYPMLMLAIACPAAFWFYGRRWLGSQTHPAALFILAWFASTFLFSGVDFITVPKGVLALLWVIISFGALAVVDRFRKKSKATANSKTPEP